MHLMIYFELNNPEIGKHYSCTHKRLKLGMVSSFDPHNMCARVERVTAKTGCTSCTNWTISFKVQGFHTKTHVLQRHFIFLSLFQKRLKLGMVSSFDPHNMCAKVERITKKTGCTSFTNWIISFKVQWFHTKTHVLQRHFIFLSLFQLKTFFASNLKHSKPHTENSTVSDFICYFSCI